MVEYAYALLVLSLLCQLKYKEEKRDDFLKVMLVVVVASRIMQQGEMKDITFFQVLQNYFIIRKHLYSTWFQT